MSKHSGLLPDPSSKLVIIWITKFEPDPELSQTTLSRVNWLVLLPHTLLAYVSPGIIWSPLSGLFFLAKSRILSVGTSHLENIPCLTAWSYDCDDAYCKCSDSMVADFYNYVRQYWFCLPLLLLCKPFRGQLNHSSFS
jgi:hypothetical protein